ncbi:MAG: efflux RND transporter permease subunit, partial [Candidatus Competibacteraceae bacterium]|nr:efflux RND transporter permease subunit [Candidatus Competibacteraceae bacterium]
MSSIDGSHSIATLFVRNRHLLGLTIVILLVAGVSALLNLPRIEDPRITNRNPTILTLLPGASATRVEALVTKKIEDRLREIAEIKQIESTSSPSISLISLELQDQIGPGENETVFSKIRDKLADATSELPPGASLPEFDDKRGAVAYSLLTAIEWYGTEEARLGILSRLAEELADRLRNIPGTDNVRLFGEPEEEITVTADPAEFAALGLTTVDAAELISAADTKTPSGILRTTARDVLLEVEGALDSTQRIARIPVAANGTGGLVTLGEIAQIAKRWQDPPQEIALADGTRTVLVAARMEDDVHVDQWAEEARAVVATLAKTTDKGIGVEVIFDQSRYTEERLASLGGNLLAGAAVVILVVLIGMGWRSALIVGAALPLSVAFALFGLTFFGQQIHQMTVFGMIIALGLLIDNAIVVTDEVRKQLSLGLERTAAVAAAVRHLFAPLLASTLTTVLGFMPIFLLSGNVGDFVGPIAISVVLALIGSFLISMTVIATLAGLFVNPSPDQGSWWRDGFTNNKLTETYRRFLLAVLHWPRLSVLVSLALPVLGFFLAATLGTQFFPPADRDQFEVEVWLGGNASINHTTGVIRQIETVMREQDGIDRVDWLVGSSYPTVYYNLVMNKDNDASYAHAIVSVRNVADVNALIPHLQGELDERFPQAQVVVSTFGQGPPYAAPVAFRIVGPQLVQLKQYGEELRRIMHTEPAILHTQASIAGGDPKLWFAAM